MVTLAVMGLIVGAVMTVLFSTYKQTGVVLNRRDVLGDGQFAMQQMTKQFRQATSIIDSSASSIDVNTFSGTRAARQVAWRVTGSQAPYTLETQIDAGAWRTVSSPLAQADSVQCKPHDGVLAQVTIPLSLGIDTSVGAITSDVQMRNI